MRMTPLLVETVLGNICLVRWPQLLFRRNLPFCPRTVKNVRTKKKLPFFSGVDGLWMKILTWPKLKLRPPVSNSAQLSSTTSNDEGPKKQFLTGLYSPPFKEPSKWA